MNCSSKVSCERVVGICLYSLYRGTSSSDSLCGVCGVEMISLLLSVTFGFFGLGELIEGHEYLFMGYFGLSALWLISAHLIYKK